MWMKFLIFFFFLGGFFLPLKILADFPLSVVINEIAWMGTKESFSNEWIELYNNSATPLNLVGWKLITEDGRVEINLEGEIPSKGFFLLERTDDETLPTIKADLIYKGGLSNKGEYLKLTDPKGKIIDEVNCASGWFEGDNETKRTMERKNPSVSGSNPENWQTSENPGGTPKAENSQVKIEGEEKFYPTNIFINEILPSPEGPDAENEWIEIFNGNDFEVDVSEWQIRDTIGDTKTYTIPKGKKIEANGFLVLQRPETKITLQNNGDGLELLNPNGEVVHQVTYEKAPLGQSYSRTSSGWEWITTLTPGKENIITQPETSKIKKNKFFIEKTEKIKEEGDQKIPLEKLTSAKIEEKIPKSSNFLIIFSVAIAIAVGSVIIVVFLKKRLVGEELEMKEGEWEL